MASKQSQLTNRSTGMTISVTIGVAIDGLQTKGTECLQHLFDPQWHPNTVNRQMGVPVWPLVWPLLVSEQSKPSGSSPCVTRAYLLVLDNLQTKRIDKR